MQKIQKTCFSLIFTYQMQISSFDIDFCALNCEKFHRSSKKVFIDCFIYSHVYYRIYTFLYKVQKCSSKSLRKKGRSLFRGPGGIEFSNRAVKNFVPLSFEASGILYPSQLTCREFCTPPETRKKTSCNKKDFVNYHYKERMERWAIKDTLKNVEKFL